MSLSFFAPVRATSIVQVVDNAQYFGASFPTKTTYAPGERVTDFQITMRNTGTSTWKGSERNIILYPFPYNNQDVYVWNGGGIVGRPVTTDVAPGETFTFDLSGNLGLAAPQTLGTYQLQWRVYRSASATSDPNPVSFGDSAPSTPLILSVVSPSRPPTPRLDRAEFTGNYINKTQPEMKIDWGVSSTDVDYFRLHWVSAEMRSVNTWYRVDGSARSFTGAFDPGRNQIELVAYKNSGDPNVQEDDIASTDVARMQFTSPSPQLPQDDAQLVSGVFPSQTTFKPGERTSATLIFKNTGSSIWTKANYFLAPVYSQTQEWMGAVDQQGNKSLTSDVPTGGEARFDLNLVAPTNSVGTFKIQWRMVRLTSEHGYPEYISFPNQTAYSTAVVWTVANPTSTLDATYFGGSFPAKTTFSPGEAVELNITMRNTGTQPWRNCYQLLLEISPSLNIGGQLEGSDCVNVFAQVGATYNFHPLVSLPMQPGTYTYQWQMASRDPGQSIDRAQRFGSISTPWTVVVASQGLNNPPVIQGITAPSVLQVREAGKWTIKAYDPEGKPLSYYVTWGDEIPQIQPSMISSPSYEKTQTATFTHYYTQPGTYEPRFTVVDSASQKVDTSASVTVKESQTVPQTGSIKITVTNGSIVCKTAPCGVLRNAKVAAYQLDDTTGAGFVGSSDTSGGTAAFYNIPSGEYTAYADAPGFQDSKQDFVVGVNDGRYLTITLRPQKGPEAHVCPPDCPVIFQPTFSDGTLIQLQRTKGIYLIENGQKRPIPSRAVFDARGFDMSDVIIVDKSDFDRYPTGNALGATPTTTTSTTLVEGSLVKALNDKSVYRIESGKRRPFLSGSVFEAKGYYWSDIIVVTADTLNAYPLGDTISYGHLGDGFLIKSPRDPSVYWTQNGQKQHIANESVFSAHAFRWQDIHVVSDDEIATYPLGSDMSR